MIGKTLLVVIVFIGLVLSGCTEHEIETVNDTTDTCTNATDATANASEHAESRSVSIPLEKPSFIEDR